MLIYFFLSANVSFSLIYSDYFSDKILITWFPKIIRLLIVQAVHEHNDKNNNYWIVPWRSRLYFFFCIKRGIGSEERMGTDRMHQRWYFVPIIPIQTIRLHWLLFKVIIVFVWSKDPSLNEFNWMFSSDNILRVLEIRIALVLDTIQYCCLKFVWTLFS